MAVTAKGKHETFTSTAVAAAVAKAAIETGVARKIVDPEEVRKNTEARLAALK